MKKIIILTIVLVLGMIIYFYYVPKDSDSGQVPDNQDLKTFVSEDYSFSVNYPDNWEQFVYRNDISPKINIYKLQAMEDEDQLPFDHFANRTNTSIFPKGIPTENLFGQNISVAESDINFSYELTDDSRVYVLENGQPFAAYLKPANRPDSWNSSGFIWVRATINNPETRCERQGEIIPREDCDPLTMGDNLIWNGQVNNEDWQEAVSVANSFEFTVELQEGRAQDILVEKPEENKIISSPLLISGEARGTWFFEATAPVTLVDWDGKIIAESYLEAEGDWMTNSFVPFSATMEFDEPENIGDFSDRGTLIFRRSNPSGLPDNDEAYEVNVRFR